MNATPKLTKGQTVFYSVRSNSFRARVERVHRDGEVTVTSLFNVDADGKDMPCAIGMKLRLHRSDLRLTARVEP